MHVSVPAKNGRAPERGQTTTTVYPNIDAAHYGEDMSSPAPTMPLDTRALTDPVDRRAVRAFTRAHGGFWTAQNVVGAIVAVVVLVMFATIAVPTFTTMLAFARDGSASPFFLLFPLLVLGLAVTMVVVGVSRLFGAGTRAYRLDGFARGNGMAYFPRVDDPPLPGMIFGLGHSRMSGDIVRAGGGRFTEIANYRYKTGSGKNESTHTWGYVAVKLDNPLPHIVLDAQGNNGLFGSNLPASFDRHQRLGLEGDFDQYFALYCPSGYERDALYLFTPDIMARFIDNAAALDVEIVDDWMFLYTRDQASTLDPARWAWLFSVISALEEKFTQWERWRDERLAAPPAAARVTDASAATPALVPLLSPPPGVAPQGRRLTRRYSWIGLLLAVVFFGAWIYTQAVDMFGSP